MLKISSALRLVCYNISDDFPPLELLPSKDVKIWPKKADKGKQDDASEL